MQTYKDFQPTGFDFKGLNGDGHGISDFLVVLSRNRDSDILSESNWHTALDLLGGESDTVQIHRFGHWACGWFELLLVDPTDSVRALQAEELTNSLENYPVLDDEDFSRREYDDQIEQIRSECGRYTKDDVPEGWESTVFSWFWDNEQRVLEAGTFRASTEDIRRCLRALRLCEPKYVSKGSILATVRGVLLTRPVFIRLRRRNPAYAFD